MSRRGGVFFRATGSADQTIQVHKLYNGENWTESNVTYDSMGYSCGVVTTAQLGNNQPTTFDLTSLVKEWINGTNIASNGFMMKGVNENTINKAFCSTEYGTTSMRSYMTLNYTPVIDVTSSVTTVNIGSSITLTANVEPEDAIVTWSSSNNSIATVSSTGVVTGVHAGSVTITATAGDSSSSVEVRVTIPEGVYRITNNYSNLYLATELSCASTIDVNQRGLYTLEPNATRIMWRVCHLGDGLYSIRPMSKLDYGLTYSSSYEVHTIFRGTNDTLGSTINAQWKISYDSSGYTITHQGYSSRTLSLESDTIASGANVVVESKTADLTRQRWSFTAITREYNGAILFNRDTNGNASTATKRYVSIGKTRGIYELGIKATAYSTESIDQDMYWTSSNSLIARVNSSTGQVTGVSPGTVTITAYKANASGTGGIGTPDSYTVVVPELLDTTYFIVNREHKKFIQAASILAPNYDTPGYALEQWEFGIGAHQQWELEVQYDGYYRIKSALSGLYMATQAGGEGSQDIFILQENKVNTPRQLWKIELTSHGSYKIKAKSSEPYSADLAVVAANMVNGSSNGIQVQQRLYVDNESYKDEWYFRINIDASLVAIEETYDRSSFFDDVVQDLSSIGYNLSYNNHTTITEGVSVEQMLYLMRNSKIVLVRAHGLRLSIEVTDGKINTSKIRNEDLSNVELVLYGACLTGVGGNTSSNLVTATHDAGARTVIGFQHKVNSGVCNQWCEHFFDYYTQYYDDPNKTIEDVVNKAKEMVMNDSKYCYIDEEGDIVSADKITIAGEYSFPD
ncbi:MAG: Ig-like domain-containing protein [Clostridia bacterium]|nr:Ig-like domain-containing protein [Clostridia bacterium]